MDFPKCKNRLNAAGVAAVAMFLTLAATSCGEQPSQTSGGSDTVFVNGKVVQYTDDGEGIAFAEAVLVRDGLIQYVGDNATAKDQAGKNAKVVDLGGKMMVPGLGDGHLHGESRIDCSLDYSGGTTEDVLGKIKTCLTSPEQEQYLKSDYLLEVANFMGEGMLPKGTRLDRTLLDRLSADPATDPFGTGTTRPIVVRNMDGHKYYTNSIAIEAAGITKDTVAPPGGYIGLAGHGDPNGQFADYEADFGEIIPQGDDAAYELFAQNLDKATSRGVTQVLRPGGDVSDLQFAKRMIDDGRLNAHLNQALTATDVRGADPAEIEEIIADLDKLRDEYNGHRSDASLGELTVDTTKIYCDGVAEYPGQTAAMLDPYNINIGTPEKPQWVPGTKRGEDPSCENAQLGFSMLDKDRWTIHLHSIGDRSSRVSLDNIEKAQRENPDWDRRHTIAHLEFLRPEDAARFGKLGVVASFSFQWAQRDGWTVDGSEGYIAQPLIDNKYAARSIADGGGVLAAGSDWDVTALIPFTAIETAIDREGEADPAKGVYPGKLGGQQAITLPESLKAATIGVAYQLHQDDKTGSIEKGKYADLIVIDQDLFSIPTEDISNTKVLLTMFKGKPVYSDPDNPVM